MPRSMPYACLFLLAGLTLFGCKTPVASSQFGFSESDGRAGQHDPERIIARVAVVRFDVDSSQASSDLGEQVAELMAHSLREQGGLRVVSGDSVDLYRPAGELDDGRARVLGRGLSVDIVVYGDVMRIGANSIVSSRILRVDGDQPSEVEVMSTRDLARFEPETEKLAESIASQLYANPALAGSRLEGKDGRWGGQGLHPSDRYWRSSTLRGDLIGVALGDVDGDGKLETVACSASGVVVARREGERFTPITSRDDIGHIVSVSCFDTNGDGRDEIVLSGIAAERPYSQLWEMRNGALQPSIEGIPYHLRAMDTPQGRQLLGQAGSLNAPFSGGILPMRRQGDELVAGEPLELPFWPDLFSFAWFNLSGSRNSGLVTLALSGQLKVYDHEGVELWVSKKAFGGKRYGYNNRTRASDNAFLNGQRSSDLVSISNAIVVADLDFDGKDEVLLAHNAGYAGSFFENIQLYYEGRVIAYGWTGLTMTELWATQAYSNYVPMCAVGDQDNDGAPELVLAVDLHSSQVPSMKRVSALAVHDMVE